jgi:hypothetical protein
MAAPGLVSPDNYPIRDPRDKAMTNGRIANPPRFYEVGGAAGPNIWTKEGGNHSFAQSPQTNIAKVEKPTSVKSAKKSPGRGEND